jgi:hypothetical protein
MPVTRAARFIDVPERLAPRYRHGPGVAAPCGWRIR